MKHDRKICSEMIFRGKHTCKGMVTIHKKTDAGVFKLICPCVCHKDQTQEELLTEWNKI